MNCLIAWAPPPVAHDVVLLLTRLYLGGFLIWGVWDNIVSAARMQEFAGFLTSIGCPVPDVAAPVSVWAQLICGVLLIPGLLTRWAGAVIAVNFIVAVVLMTGAGLDARTVFEPAICVFVGLILMTGGAGRFSVDSRLDGRA